MTHTVQTLSPSSWVIQFVSRIQKGGEILDIACGRGRNTRFFLDHGHSVVAVDRNLERLGELCNHPKVSAMEVDLEGTQPWPFQKSRFAGIVVTNYLYRPLFPRFIESLDDNGVLIYETFAKGNERFGHPRNPDYLLEDGELLQRFGPSLYIISYEQLELGEPNPAVLQRIAAIKNPNPWH